MAENSNINLKQNLEKLALKPVFEAETSDPFETSNPLFLLKVLTEALDNVRIVSDENYPLFFKVEYGLNTPKSVIQGKITNNQRVDKPSQEIIVTINPKTFTFKDIASLIKEITEKHNSWIEKTYRNDSNTDFDLIKLWKINPGLAIAKKYLAVVQILTKGLAQNDQTEKQNISHISILNVYTKDIEPVCIY